MKLSNKLLLGAMAIILVAITIFIVYMKFELKKGLSSEIDSKSKASISEMAVHFSKSTPLNAFNLI